MPQVRNSRDRIKRELTQAQGLMDNVQTYLESCLGDLMQSADSYDKLTAEQKSFYPPDHESVLLEKQELNALILEGIEGIKQSIQLLHDKI